MIADFALPLLRLLPPEAAHGFTVSVMAAGLARGGQPPAYPRLRSRVWDLDFPSPIGLAAGFDKDARAFVSAWGFGFGFVEVGTVTPLPQAGNPRPRLFRLTEDAAVVNRMGFNNRGVEAMAARLERWRAKGRGPGPVGANIGRNKDSVDAIADYVACATRLSPLCDYLVVNVSSPNTPGLRDLQRREPLLALTRAVRQARDAAAPGRPPPLLLKVAPDLDEEGIADIAMVARAAPVDGLIVSNTTLARPANLRSAAAAEAGGLSGAPLFTPSTEVLSKLYAATDGAVPLIGVGGVSSAAEAYAKIRAGARLVQLYTALVYQGPGLVARILAGLDALIAEDGFARVEQAVGADHRAMGGPSS